MYRLLISVFVYGFFKKYAKVFFLFFAVFASYFLFIQTAGDFFDHSQEYYSFFIAFQVLNEPISLALFFLLYLGYILLSMRFIKTQLRLESNLFLQYSLKGLGRKNEFKVWMLIYTALMSPAIVYSLFVTGIGLYLKHIDYWYLMWTVNGLSILMPSLRSGTWFVLNRPDQQARNSRSGLKFSSINIFKIRLLYRLMQSKILFTVTKIFGAVFLLVSISYFNSPGVAARELYFLALCLASIHSVLIYKSFLYETKYMAFVLNLPYSRIRRFVFLLIDCSVLILIELTLVWCLTDTWTATRFLFFTVGNMAFIWGLVMTIGDHPLAILKTLTLYFFISLLFVLYGYPYWSLVVVSMGAYGTFIRRYHLDV